MSKPTVIFTISCRTGCTCCRGYNHYRGLYLSREEAEARIARFRKGIDNPVGSQYSRHGSYSINQLSCEPISGQRIIVDTDRIYLLSQIKTVRLDGSLVSGDDYLESMNEW